MSPVHSCRIIRKCGDELEDVQGSGGMVGRGALDRDMNGMIGHWRRSQYPSRRMVVVCLLSSFCSLVLVSLTPSAVTTQVVQVVHYLNAFQGDVFGLGSSERQEKSGMCCGWSRWEDDIVLSVMELLREATNWCNCTSINSHSYTAVLNSSSLTRIVLASLGYCGPLPWSLEERSFRKQPYFALKTFHLYTPRQFLRFA